jgi:hypothetical protein
LPEIEAKALQPEPESLWDFFQKLAARTLESSDFHLFSPFGEKHGSWEAVFWRPAEKDAGKITRFISLDFTEENQDLYAAEIWVAAQKEPEVRAEAKYFRRLVSQFTMQNQFEFFNRNKDVTPDVRQNISVALNKAAEIALGFQLEDLISTYPRFVSPRRYHTMP